MSNSLAKKPKFSVAIQQKAYQDLINNTLGDKELARRFIASVSSAVRSTPALQECDSDSIVVAALLGETLGLAPSPQLGQFYMVPFKQKEKRDRQGNVISPETTKAQFVLGYKGYLQMAMASGQYTKINVLEIKEGELVHFDPLNEEIDCMIIDDVDKREAAQTVGYYAMFEYKNGFRKAIYWSKQKMERHADRYSQAFSLEAYRKLQRGEIPEKDMWRYSSFWYKDFDGMAKKTMLRQLLSHWGALSTRTESGSQMVQALEADGKEIVRQGDAFVSVDVDEELLDVPDNDSPDNSIPADSEDPFAALDEQ